MTASLPSFRGLTHPRTGFPLRALGFTRSGKPIWPVMGGSEPAGEPTEPAKGGLQGGQEQPKPTPAPKKSSEPAKGSEGSAEGPNGYPENTPVAEMTDRQAAAYWRHQSRRHEDGRKAAQKALDDAKPKIDGYDALEAASRSEHERALDEAKKTTAEQVRAEERSKSALALVGAEFRAAAAGRLTAEQVAGFLDDLDRSKFLGSDGQPDLERIAARVDLWAPKPEVKRVDVGQGRRDTTTPSGVEAGRAAYQAKHGKKTSSTS